MLKQSAIVRLQEVMEEKVNREIQLPGRRLSEAQFPIHRLE